MSVEERDAKRVKAKAAFAKIPSPMEGIAVKEMVEAGRVYEPTLNGTDTIRVLGKSVDVAELTLAYCQDRRPPVRSCVLARLQIVATQPVEKPYWRELANLVAKLEGRETPAAPEED
jgi:hypothetical protein